MAKRDVEGLAPRRERGPRRNQLDFFGARPHGEKGDFVKLTITLPPEVYNLLVTETARRKIAKEKDAMVSSIIREAVVEKLVK